MPKYSFEDGTGTPFESEFISDLNIMPILELLPNNTQELIKPIDVRGAVFSLWENIAFKKSIINNNKYLGLSLNNENYIYEFNSDQNGLPLLFGRPTINNSTTHVLNNLIGDTDIFIYNSKPNGDAPESTKVQFLAGTDDSLFLNAPYIEAFHNTGASGTIDLNIINDNGNITLQTSGELKLEAEKLIFDYNTQDGVLKPAGENYDVQIKVDDCEFGAVDANNANEGYLLTLEDDGNNQLVPTWKKPFLEEIIPGLSQVLEIGNETGENDIIFNDGDSLIFGDHDFKLYKETGATGATGMLIFDSDGLIFNLNGDDATNNIGSYLRVGINGELIYDDLSSATVSVPLDVILAEGERTKEHDIILDDEDKFYFGYDSNSDLKRNNFIKYDNGNVVLNLSDDFIIGLSGLPAATDSILATNSNGIIEYISISSLTTSNWAEVLSEGNISNSDVIIDQVLFFGEDANSTYPNITLENSVPNDEHFHINSPVPIKITSNSSNIPNAFLKTDTDGYLIFDASGGSGGNLTLNDVLNNGNITDGKDIEISNEDSIIFKDNLINAGKIEIDVSASSDNGLIISTFGSTELRLNLAYLNLPPSNETNIVNIDENGTIHYSDGDEYLQDLSEVLSNGNTTDGSDIRVTNNDKIYFESSGGSNTGNINFEETSLANQDTAESGYLNINSIDRALLLNGEQVQLQINSVTPPSNNLLATNSDGFLEYIPNNITPVNLTLDAVLSNGNTTSGNNIRISIEDKIYFESSGGSNAGNINFEETSLANQDTAESGYLNINSIDRALLLNGEQVQVQINSVTPPSNNLLATDDDGFLEYIPISNTKDAFNVVNETQSSLPAGPYTPLTPSTNTIYIFNDDNITFQIGNDFLDVGETAEINFTGNGNVIEAIGDSVLQSATTYKTVDMANGAFNVEPIETFKIRKIAIHIYLVMTYHQ